MRLINSSLNERGRKPFTHHLLQELEDPTSNLRETTGFLLSVLRCQEGHTIPEMDEKGYWIKDFLFLLEETEAATKAKLIAVRDWLSQPTNNKYNRTYLVPPDCNRNPDRPKKMCQMLTPRDTFAFLTKVYGEETPGGDLVLPTNWANRNPDELDIYVEAPILDTQLAMLLHINQHDNVVVPGDDDDDE